jgi:hypothetical protein
LAEAQSDNYWSWNFNTPSTLLGGAVVGGGAGPSAVFYNPAQIDHENVPSLSLSANIISLQFFNADNIAGEGIDASKFIFKVQPRFISYVLPNNNDRLGLEAAILSPVSDEIEYTIQHLDQLDIIKRTAGPEKYSGYLRYRRKYDETFAGFGFSYELSDKWWFGASSFLSIKTLKYEFRQLAQAYQQGDSVLVDGSLQPRYISSNGFNEELKYWDLSFIFKLGLQYKTLSDRFSAGINLSFPNIPLYGEANVRKAFDRSNVHNDQADAFTKNEAYIGVNEKERTTIKNPFSVALGFQYYTANRRNAVSFTMEYFHKIDSYAIIDPKNQTLNIPEYLEPFIGAEDVMSYHFKADAVTNAAVGFKQYFSPKFFVLGGFRTDFTAGSTDDIRFLGEKFKINQIHVDKYHITVGPVLRIKRFDVVTGIQYTLGRNADINQVINYSRPVEYNPATRQALEGARDNSAKARIDEIAIFFGVIVDLAKQN